jgi:hypothetical protein
MKFLRVAGRPDIDRTVTVGRRGWCPPTARWKAGLQKILFH